MSDINTNIFSIGKDNKKTASEQLMSFVENMFLAGFYTSADQKKIDNIILNIEKMIQDYGVVNNDLSKNAIDLINEALERIVRHTIRAPKELVAGDLEKDLNKIIVAGGEIRNIKYVSSQRFHFDRHVGILRMKFDDESIYSRTYPIVKKVELLIASKTVSENFKSIALFVDLMEQVPGTMFKIQDLEVGSIIARFLTFFKSKESEDFFDEVLKGATDIAISKLKKDGIENEKVKSETEKNKAEFEKIKLSNEIDNSELSWNLRNLKAEELQETIRAQKLDNSMKEIQVFLQKKQVLKELVAEQMITQDQYRIAVKGELIFVKHGNMTVPFPSLGNDNL